MVPTRRRQRRGAVEAAAAALLLALPAAAAPPPAAAASDGCVAPVDMQLTFAEEFERLDVSAWGPGTRWIAHTPWAGDFGRAKFTDPQKGFPFLVTNGVLRIEARRDETGRWRSGLLASVDREGNGFSQLYGYFEMRAKLPTGEGVWPAFWLIGLDRSRHTAEIDVIEFYGNRPNRYTSVVHVWPRKGKHRSWWNRNEVFTGEVRPDQFHTYGVMVDPDRITFFFDRCPVWHTPTPPEHRQPMYVLLNLALGGGNQTIENTPDPSHMYVDYVRAYARKGTTPAPAAERGERTASGGDGPLRRGGGGP